MWLVDIWWLEASRRGGAGLEGFWHYLEYRPPATCNTTLLWTSQGPIWHLLWHSQTFTHCHNSFRLLRQFQTVKTVEGCHDNWRLSRQLKTVKTVEDCQDSWRLSRQFQTVKTVAGSQDSWRLLGQFQTVKRQKTAKKVADSQEGCRLTI